MSIIEAQVPLPAPPTGMDRVYARHKYNPENGFYEPSLRNPPQNAGLPVTNVAQNLGPVLALLNPMWIYHMVFANNTAAVRTYTLTEPGANTYVVVVPTNNSVVLISTPDAPLFKSTAGGNLTVVGDAALSGNVTIAYVIK